MGNRRHRVRTPLRPRKSLLLAALGLGILFLLPSAAVAATPPGTAPEAAVGPSPVAATVASALGLPYTYHQLLGFNATLASHLLDPRSVPADQMVTIGIAVSPPDPAALHSAALAVATGRSVPLTALQFREELAPTRSSYEALQQYLQGAGLTVVSRYSNHVFLLAEGSAATVNRLFSTTLIEGSWNGRLVMTPASAPVVPAAIAPWVLSVTGLSTGVSPFSLPVQEVRPVVTSYGSLIGWNVPHAIYGISRLYNASGSAHFANGTTIGILLWGDGYSPSDIQTFAQNYYPSEFPPFTLTPVPLDGAPPPSSSAVNDPSEAPLELTLDIEWAASQAPGAHIVAAYVPDGPKSSNYSPSDAQLEDGLSYLVNASGMTVISQSFGTPDGGDPSFQATSDYLYQVAASRGISVFAASGDNGGAVPGPGGSCGTTPQPMYPAASPYVTAVGGTAPVLSTNILGAPTLQSQPAWPFSGGGFSSTYTAPSWQLVGSADTAITTLGGGHRGIPDVSGPAGNDTIYYNGQLLEGAGTSFASPMWAGMVDEMTALQGRHFGLLGPRLYALGAEQDQGLTPPPYYDVTQGETPGEPATCLWYATKGWDPATGWGTPLNALTLYGDLINGYATLNVSFSSAVVAPGATLSFTVQVTNASGPIPGVPVNLTFYSHPQFVGTQSVIGSATVTTGSNGMASGTFQVPLDYLYSQILVETQVFTRFAVGSTLSVLSVSPLASSWGALAPLLDYPINIVFFLSVVVVATLLGYYLGRSPRTPGSFRRTRPQRRIPPPISPPPGTGSGLAPAITGPPLPPSSSPPPPPPEAGGIQPWVGPATGPGVSDPVTSPSPTGEPAREPEQAALPPPENTPLPEATADPSSESVPPENARAPPEMTSSPPEETASPETEREAPSQPTGTAAPGEEREENVEGPPAGRETSTPEGPAEDRAGIEPTTPEPSPSPEAPEGGAPPEDTAASPEPSGLTEEAAGDPLQSLPRPLEPPASGTSEPEVAPPSAAEQRPTTPPDPVQRPRTRRKATPAAPVRGAKGTSRPAICPKCHRPVPARAKLCPSCGAKAR